MGEGVQELQEFRIYRIRTRCLALLTRSHSPHHVFLLAMANLEV
jgi:hypothetical protein